MSVNSHRRICQVVASCRNRVRGGIGTLLFFVVACISGLIPVRASPAENVSDSSQIGSSISNGPASRATSTSTVTNLPDRMVEGIKGLEHRPKEDFDIRVSTNTPAEVVLPGSLSSLTNKTLQWDISWHGWRGLSVSMSEETHLKNPRELLGLKPMTNVPSLHLEQLKMSTVIGGVLEFDGAIYHNNGTLDLPNDVQFRRAKLIAQGDCIIVLPVGYKFELGYVPHRFNLNEAWLSSEQLDYIGSIVAGVFQPPMGLDLATSSRDLTFMEPATVLQALAPANETGIQIGHPVFNGGGTWMLGIFAGGVIATEYGNASQEYGNLIGRVTYLALDHMAPQNRPEENRYLHLGLSANLEYSASSIVQYRSRPESYLADFLIDTGVIDANGSGAIGAEAAYVNGPLTLQGELIDSLVRRNSGQALNFYGFYTSASWYLTRESRPYDRINGRFKRLIPKRNFNFDKGGAWGAFEVAARFSYTDLTDNDVHGGRIGLMMGELNWYLHSHVRWMFNAGGGHVSGGAHDGNLLLFQSRVGVDF